MFGSSVTAAWPRASLTAEPCRRAWPIDGKTCRFVSITPACRRRHGVESVNWRTAPSTFERFARRAARRLSTESNAAPGLVAAATEPDPEHHEAERTRRGLEDWTGQMSASTEAFAEHLLAKVHQQVQDSLEAQLRTELARARAIDHIDLLVAIELVKLRENLQHLLDGYRVRLESRAAEADRRAHEMTRSWTLVQERLRTAQDRARMLRQEQAEIKLMLLHGSHPKPTPAPRATQTITSESLIRFGECPTAARRTERSPVAIARSWPDEEQTLTECWVFFYAWLSVLAGMETTLALVSAQHAVGYVMLSGTACILLLGRTARLLWAIKRRPRGIGQHRPASPPALVSTAPPATTPASAKDRVGTASSQPSAEPPAGSS
ncbi:hypothetical protein F1559_002665 [Cyanidiococcus yangmingshanensis]|uniref:Uncharacterized protein n=1 Tax=Cyanidiococcus yangmingshanensis TaxID=2690220 RepID=A0A7J7IJZ4_9RHOD|nr:hypothetical protein F1559_002665 [Cyanidiococcus yangmingshanensis]